MLSTFSIYSRSARLSVYLTFRPSLIVSRTGEPRSYTSKTNLFHHYLPTAFSLSIVMEGWSDHREVRNLPSSQVPPPPRKGRILSFFFPLVLAVLSFHSWSGFKLKHPFCTWQGVKKQTASKYSQKFWVTLKIYSSNTHTHSHTYICTHIHFTIWNLSQTSFENCTFWKLKTIRVIIFMDFLDTFDISKSSLYSTKEYRHTWLYCGSFYCFLWIVCFLENEGLWQTYIKQVYWHLFANSICSLFLSLVLLGFLICQTLYQPKDFDSLKM